MRVRALEGGERVGERLGGLFDGSGLTVQALVLFGLGRGGMRIREGFVGHGGFGIIVSWFGGLRPVRFHAIGCLAMRVARGRLT